MTNPAATQAHRPAVPGDWTADLSRCTVSFAVPNFRWRTVTGQLPVTSAGLTVGPAGRPVALRAELDAAGLDTGNRRRDSDLRGPRFLATDQWPAIGFEASEIQAAGDGWTVAGTLAVRDTRCPLRLDVAIVGADQTGSVSCVDLTATGQLDRRSAGVTAAPAFLVGHIISLSLTVRLCPPAD
jgi:polyisoprenoid-binding protein YceI